MNETIFGKLSKDILNDEYFKYLFEKISLLYAEGLFNFLNENNKLSHIEYTHLLRFADILSNSSDSKARNKSYQIIGILNDNYNQDPIYRTYSNAVFAKLGNFPAIQYLNEKDNNKAELPFDRSLELDVKKIIQTVPDGDGVVFTDAQYALFKELSNSKFFSFSGPTSMGKSFLIKSFIRKALSNKSPENLVIMVPTRALINQFALDLMKELNETLNKFNYRVATNSNVTDFSDEMSKNYIFVLTPERLISYLSQKDNPSLGFIFVDEAHKIASEKDMRSVTSYIAIQNTLKKFPNINLYFASPNVSNPEVFLHLFNKEINNSFYTIESPVSQNLFFIDLLEKSITQYIDEKSYNHETDFFVQLKVTNQVIRRLGDEHNNIVYCNSKPRTIEKSFEFYQQMKHENVETNKEVKRAISQIKSYIHKDYYLATFLGSGIAYHYGNLPQIIRNIVEELYRKECIQYIFCTSTLLEGVNLPAKNIFILVNKNGPSAFTPIDFWNLAGRAGRLSKELSGNIYCIKDNVKDWKNDDILKKKDEIVLKPTVFSKIDKNLKKIEKLLLNKTISGTQTEKNILEYIANIICIDTMEIDTEYKSPLIQKLIEKNKDKIIEYAKNKTINLKVPLSILNSNQSIGLNIQNKVYISIYKNHTKLPKVDYNAC
jgi:replicative superfamily II helicase